MNLISPFDLSDPAYAHAHIHSHSHTDESTFILCNLFHDAVGLEPVPLYTGQKAGKYPGQVVST